MASERETFDSSIFERLFGNQNASLVLPLIMGIATAREDQEESDPESPNRSQYRVFLINPLTRSMVVFEAPPDFQALLQELSSKDGPLPASKASIEAMPTVKITEDGECSICLEDWEAGGEVREMPCKHRFHAGCIEKWLRIHGSCPVCRYEMPVEEEEHKKRGGASEGSEDREGRAIREFLMRILIGDDRRNSNSDLNPESRSSDSNTGPRPDDAAAVDESSAPQDMEY